MPRRKDWTKQQLADAVGIGLRTLQRLLARGLPAPTAGEPLERWLDRARPWIAANKAKPGPKPTFGDQRDPNTLGFQTWRWKTARADLAEIEVQVRRGELHSMAVCEQETVGRYGELVARFRMLPDRLARRFGHAIPPETVKLDVEGELRQIFEDLQRPSAAEEPDDQVD